MTDRVRAYRVTLDFYDLNHEFESDKEVLDEINNLTSDYGFVTVRKVVRKDIRNWSDEHPLNYDSASGHAASEIHFADGQTVYPKEAD